MSNKRSYNQTGLYTRVEESALDGRTSVAKLIKELRLGLQEYVGVTTIASELLIQRVIYKTIRLSSYENATVENRKHEEVPHYLPMANSLRRDLEVLQTMAGEAKPPDLKDYIDTNYNKRRRKRKCD